MTSKEILKFVDDRYGLIDETRLYDDNDEPAVVKSRLRTLVELVEKLKCDIESQKKHEETLMFIIQEGHGSFIEIEHDALISGKTFSAKNVVFIIRKGNLMITKSVFNSCACLLTSG